MMAGRVTSVTIVGGHGEIALRLARILSRRYRVHSLVRQESHYASVRATGALPVLLDLELNSSADFARIFEKYQTDVVIFAAGASGGNWRTKVKSVDYGGAIKVFDAIERMRNPARLIMLSTIDSRPADQIPPHYNRHDILAAAKYREILGEYLPCKYEADRDLWNRHTFRWTIVRPGWLSDAPGSGTADIGMTHITRSVSRDDVVHAIVLLVDRPDADGLALDIVGGDTPIPVAMNHAIRHRITNIY